MSSKEKLKQIGLALANSQDYYVARAMKFGIPELRQCITEKYKSGTTQLQHFIDLIECAPSLGIDMNSPSIDSEWSNGGIYIDLLDDDDDF